MKKFLHFYFSVLVSISLMLGGGLIMNLPSKKWKSRKWIAQKVL